MNEEIISSLKSKFADSIVKVTLKDIETSITVKKEKLYEILSTLKNAGFDHLSDVSCVDYIKEQQFEIIYHLWSHTKKLRVNIKVRISRERPLIKSVVDLWIGAQIHERENHEMFGVDFLGNPNLSPLFLEDWKEIPPFRKDFNVREFVRREYYEKE
ncbi:NADH-quinone oxidoreductase subunit C [Candidatus Bathyarchaeota archaeon]|nr:NADH-quinone oxidoreductase subunit C [Candidatus Bathyarchaeota archaeon]